LFIEDPKELKISDQDVLLTNASSGTGFNKFTEHPQWRNTCKGGNRNEDTARKKNYRTLKGATQDNLTAGRYTNENELSKRSQF